jgi:hypothetical protein
MAPYTNSNDFDLGLFASRGRRSTGGNRGARIWTLRQWFLAALPSKGHFMSSGPNPKFSRRNVLRAGGTLAAGVAIVPAFGSTTQAAAPASSRSRWGLGRPPFRIVSASGTLSRSAPNADKTKWENIWLAPGDADGSVSNAVRVHGGKGSWSTYTSPVRNDFIYVGIDADYKPAAPGGTALVKVNYFDAGAGFFTIQYSSINDTYAPAGIVRLTGGNVWRTHVFRLNNIDFAGQQTLGADFRISSWDPELGRSSTDVAVSDVFVSFADFYPRYHISVTKPDIGAQVHGTVPIQIYAPGMKNLEAYTQHQPDASHPDPGYGGYQKLVQRVTPDPVTGLCTVDFPARNYPRGPLTVIINAWDSPAGDNSFTRTDTFYLQLFNAGGVYYQEGIPSGPPPAAQGMRLAYQDDFTRPLSISLTGAGATYSAQKPDLSEPTGGGEFGDAIFADPNGPYNPFAIVGGQYLRIRSTRTPDGYADPRGWDRVHFGGLLASLRFDRSGIAAPNAYFEARMLAPGGEGTWPAFWLLPQYDSPDGDVEVDITELYGNATNLSRETYHIWSNPAVGEGIPSPFAPNNPTFTGWHLYGSKITPTETIWYLDNVEVWRYPTAPQGSAPMFFMLNLSLGSGWPVHLMTKYHDQVDLYVDYVRIFQG